MEGLINCECGDHQGRGHSSCQWRIMSDHLFMPRKLALIHSDEAGQLLVNQFVHYAENSEIQYIGSTLGLFLRCTISAPEPTLLSDAVRKPVFLVAVPLIDHNAVVLFNNRLQGSDEGKVLVSALDILPHPNSIHSESVDNKPYPSACKLAIPRRSLVVPLEEIRSKAFLEQLAALGTRAQYPLREQKTSHEVTETRKPAIPTYVFDLLNKMQIAQSSMEPEVFSKSIRLDSVRRSTSDEPWTRSAAWVALKSVVHLVLVQLNGFQLGTQIYKCNMLLFQSSFVRQLLQLHKSGKCRRDFGELRELSAYLAKKASKLQHFFPWCHETLKETYDTCESVNQVVTTEWAQYLQSEKLKHRIDIESLGRIDVSDTWNPLTSARTALTEALRTDSVLESTRCRTDRSKSIQITEVRVRQVHLVDDSMKFNPRPWMEMLTEDLLVRSSDNLERALLVVETFIGLHLWPHRLMSYSDEKSLLAVSQRLLITYYQQCTQRYQGDAVRLSKMILHCCTLVAWMDAVCVQWDPLKMLGDHQLFIIETVPLQDLLLMDAADVDLLHQVCDYITNRTCSTKPGFMDVSASGLANCYASKNWSMLTYEQRYFEEHERLRKAKETELNNARSEYYKLKSQADQLKCTCEEDRLSYTEYYKSLSNPSAITNNYHWQDILNRCKTRGKCWYLDRMRQVEHSVYIYEKRLPDDSVKRRSIIFHHLMPNELIYLVESCSFFVTICAANMGFPPFPGSPYTWNEIDYSRRIALGSNTEAFLNTRYGKKPSILTSDSYFIVPQGKNVQLLFKQSSSHGYVSGGFVWNLTRYCQLAIGRPFEGLKFAVHGTSHTENDVLAIQNLCPTDVELTSWNEFGIVRAGGYLQWRNMAAAFEGSALELNSLPVAMLFLQAAYQVGPLPDNQHWKFDLSETSFVRLLFDHITLAAERIRHNWSAHRALFVCISICTYVVQRVPPEMTEKGLEVLELCRQISIQWSSSVESSIAAVASKSVVDKDSIRALFYVNSLIVLTFKLVEEPTSEELFQLLRARTIMYEKRYLPRDEELERVASLCSRIMASHEELVHRLIIKFGGSPLTLVAKDRFPQGQVSLWTRCSSSDIYQSTCSTEYSTSYVIHFNVFDGTFMVDGEPIGCLSDGILKHHLFQKNFPSASLPVFHRGGGVYETTGLKDTVYTFALAGSSLVAKERRNGRSSRLIDVQAFSEDLPQPLINEHSFWMAYDGLEHHIELRRPNMFLIGDYRPIYRIELNSHLDGQVKDVDTCRLLLNYRGTAFDTVFKSFLWRLDEKSFIVPFLSRQSESADADQWTLCLRLHRLHQHVEIHCSEGSVKVQVREFENMVVPADQFLGTFIGLEHLLVLERPNGIRTIIVPHLDYTTELIGPHLKLKPKSLTPNAAIPFFSFDEDRSLKQMRPHGSETMVSWLMCCYLHGVTSSAMRDPLTHLTGLEMAIAQLRRCYSTKPFDNLGYDILTKISQLSVDRCAVCDTEIVQWDESRPSYSSSEVYKLLVHLIHSKSVYLGQLHNFDLKASEKPNEMYGRAIIRHQGSCSNDLQLTDGEKQQLGIAPVVLRVKASNFITTDSFIRSMTEYYHLLFDQKQIHLFSVALDAATRNVQMPESCSADFPTQLSMKWQTLSTPEDVPRFATKYRSRTSLPGVTSGTCLLFEEAFKKCLRIEPSSGRNVDFPFNLTASDQEPIASELVDNLKKSWDRFHDFELKNGVPRVHGDVSTIRRMLRSIEHKVQQTVSNSWEDLQRCLQPPVDDWANRCRQASGLLSFEAPRTLFARYCRSQSHLSAEIRKQVGRHLVYLVYLQKATRCLEMVDTWESTQEDQRRHFGQRLVREIAESHCEVWAPEDHPKWLIFEVENNVLIRRIQAQVALKIIRGEEQILQLNMGEGKTSVISPLVCSSLADGKHVVQLTLLTSLLETHGQEMALKLSGLLEQPVYYFPCRRDIRFDKNLIDRMITSFKECVKQGGCIVTVPEFRLSLLLKLEEMIIHQVNHFDGKISEEVKSLLQLFALHQSHVIDLVDEADEILRHKYQLLYTMGSQVPIDGGERRWQVLQDVLTFLFPQSQLDEESCTIPSDLARLELNEEESESKLVTVVIDELLSGRISGLAYFALFHSQSKEKIRKYLSNQLQSVDDLNELKSQLTDLQLQDLLILRGLLSFRVLPHALKKRWSVDYGVDVNSKRRLMAVPFRGKDTPMPRTEFGHPDVCLVLTHMSYYHAGLSVQQVMDALSKLVQLPNREAIYQEWMSRFTDPSAAIPADVNSVNFDDTELLKKLGVALRYNRPCIHFWLNCCVLPKETRQFPFKLMATSWDLAREYSQPLRGFSGTKDSSFLLPGKVRLGSLPQLESTDGDVLSRVTDQTNRKVHNVSPNGQEVSARSVIDFIVSCGKGNILIDCGALMVGMSNRQVAEYWLSRAPTRFVAAAYFQENNVRILLRDGHETPLTYSPLKGRLADVLIYLDDIHTRGTDFKFPIPAHGYVTLGRKLPKDKLVQACMRMRNLGHGHSISFLAPREVYVQLQKLSDPPESPHVIQWALQNTIVYIQNGLLEWASQGFHFSRRVTATELFQSRHLPHWTESQRFQYFTRLIQIPETLQLSDMYEALQSSALAKSVLRETKNRQVQSLSQSFRDVVASQLGESEVLGEAVRIASAVVEHCDKYLGQMELKSKCLDEEQEKELEEEKEQEREIHRPQHYDPFKPQRPKWIDDVLNHRHISSIKELTPLWEAMKRTRVYSLSSNEDFDPRILTSDNFRRILKYELSTQDEFVRPPRWMLILWGSSKDQLDSAQHLILASPFEANILVPLLRQSKLNNATLHRFAPRTRRDQAELLTSDLTFWPGSGPFLPSDHLKIHLKIAVMTMTLFGCSTCLQSKQTGRSMTEFRLFLNILPPPDTCQVGLDDSDWNILLEEGWINSEGFLVRPLADLERSRLGQSGRQFLQGIYAQRNWRRSPVAAVRGLVPLRNMSAFFQQSDLESILFSK